MRTTTAFPRRMANACGMAVLLSLLASRALAGDIRTIEIQAEEFEFSPATVQVEPGETIRLKLVNRGNMSHNLHLREDDKKTETIQAGKNDTIELTAPEEGALGFYCAVPGHESAGMKGRIVVQ